MNTNEILSISSETLERQYLELILAIKNPFNNYRLSQVKNPKEFFLEQ